MYKGIKTHANGYTESVLFQYDLQPGLSNTMNYTMQKNGTIKNLKYYLDPSSDDNCHVNILVKKRLGAVQSLIQFPNNGNQLIRGTNYAMQVDLNVNIEMVYADQIIIDMVSTSALDSTIMCVLNIEYEGGQW